MPEQEDDPVGFPELRRQGAEPDRPETPARPTFVPELPEALQRNRERRTLEEQLDAEAMRVNGPLTRFGGWLVAAFVVAFLLDLGSSILLLTSAGWVVVLQRLCYAVEWIAGAGLVITFVAALVFGYRQNQRRKEILGDE